MFNTFETDWDLSMNVVYIISAKACESGEPVLNIGGSRAESCFWPGLGLPRPKAKVVIPKNQPLPKHLRKKRVKVRSTPATTLQKKKTR